MEVVVVYESMFGNTRTVAADIADGLREADPAAQVTLLPVAEASAGRVGRPDLLVVGGPTHMLRMSSERSRQIGLEALKKPARDGQPHHEPEPGAAGPGVREWLAELPKAAPGSRAAAFDTHMPYPLAGRAARPIASQLRNHGYRLAAKAAGFVVTGGEGPLRDGEREKAKAWGKSLAQRVRT